MISPEQEREILRLAYIPEHIVTLMKTISKGDPFLKDRYLFFKKEDWLIFIGYPIGEDFSTEKFLSILEEVMILFKPAYSWIVAPEIPERLKIKAKKFESDFYYILKPESFLPPKRLKRLTEGASLSLNVSWSKKFTAEHERLIEEFISLKRPSPFVEGLYRSMKDYIPSSSSALLLDARTHEGDLSAFYVLELEAQRFLTYLLGCRSEKIKIPHASDLLFLEMIEVAKKMEKEWINLGLGITEGIRRFKKKWGGLPSIPYEFVEIREGSDLGEFIFAIDSILSKL